MSTSGYTVLARRYRSRSFDELVGQEPIARTLRNAIESGRTAHAYLFCGTRGVGKTSMARIFAAALNVDPSLEQSEEITEAILRGDDLDVIEIDGASNRGIQEARELIAGAGLSPARSPYKIYIIDEVHMLTREAFNALLKTMEEPPDHVKFILCTTEPHKVPATIQSRCQRFDFRPIPTGRIAEQLRHVLEQESVGADDEVVAAVARLGRGSMRDALSLLDRLLASGEERLTGELLEQMLGVADQTIVSDLFDAIDAGEPAEALRRGEALLAGGSTIEQALELLTEYLRTLMVVQACGPDSDLVELSAEARQVAAKQAEGYDAAALVHMIALCDNAGRNVRGSSTARALFDAAVVRLCMSRHLADIGALLSGGGAPGDGGGSAAPRKKKVERAQPLTPPPAPERDAAPAPAAPAARPDIDVEPARRAAATAPEAATERAAPKPDAVRAAARSPDGDDDNAHVPDDRLWPTVLEFATRSHIDRAMVEGLRPVGIEGGTLRLSVAESGADYARFLSGQTGRLAELIRRATGRRVRVEVEAPTRPSARPAVSDEMRETAAELPFVRQAMELFDAEILDVRTIEGDDQIAGG